MKFIQQNEFENVICKIPAILFRIWVTQQGCVKHIYVSKLGFKIQDYFILGV